MGFVTILVKLQSRFATNWVLSHIIVILFVLSHLNGVHNLNFVKYDFFFIKGRWSLSLLGKKWTAALIFHLLKFKMLYKMSEVLKSGTWNKKNYQVLFFCKIFVYNVEFWNGFHIHDNYNLFYMNIYIEKTFRQFNIKRVENI